MQTKLDPIHSTPNEPRASARADADDACGLTTNKPFGAEIYPETVDRPKTSSANPTHNPEGAEGQQTAASTQQLNPYDRLKRFLQAYWLRPENSLWMALRSEALTAAPLHAPCADFGCGDGVFSFLHLGGSFHPAFDVFTDVTLSDADTGRPDMFDCASDAYQPAIVSPPTHSIDVGVDLKVNMLTKANALALYDQLIQHDNNEPLPFPAERFRTIYCNAAYWIDNIDRFLAELHRIVQPGGQIILQVKLDCLSRYTLEAHRPVLGDRFLEIIAGQRLNCWPSLTDRATWENRFQQAGLSIEQATPFVTKTHAHIWDIGLRPIAPLLVKMANALSPQTRAEIKAEWVDRLLELTTPLCTPDLHIGNNQDEPAEMQYVLGRN